MPVATRQHTDAPVLLLAHGAGAPMDSDFMEAIAQRIAARGMTVARFEFQYMAARRHGGVKRPPPRIEVLAGEYRAAVAAIRTLSPDAPLLIGGKSMGGRVASMIAGDLLGQRQISGCVCLGYPLHPPKKPASLRTAHLTGMTCPTLIAHGERDPLGTRTEFESLTRAGVMSAAIQFAWIRDGDHDLKPRAASGRSHADNLDAAADAVSAFVAQLATAHATTSAKRPKPRLQQ